MKHPTILLVGLLVGSTRCASVELREEADPAAVVPIRAGTVRVTGGVVFPDGSDAAGLPIGVRQLPAGGWTVIGRTGADGSYEVSVPRGSEVTVLAWITKPGGFVVGSESDGEATVDFEAERPCDVEFAFRRGDEAASGTVSIARDNESTSYAVVDASHSATVRVPCAWRHIRVSGSAGVWEADQADLSSSAGPVQVDLTPSRAVRVVVTDSQSRPLAGRTVSAAGGGISQTDDAGRAAAHLTKGRPDAVIVVESAAGVLLASSRIEMGARANGGAPSSKTMEFGLGTWTEIDGELQVSVVVPEFRRVELVCEGLDASACVGAGVRCGVAGMLESLPWIFPRCSRTPDVWPSGPVEGMAGEGRLMCVCPTHGAVLDAGGRTIPFADEATRVTLDVRAVRGGVRGQVVPTHPCGVQGKRKYDRGLLSFALGTGAVSAQRKTTCDATGTFALDHLEPGEWTIEVSAQDGRKTTKTVTVGHEVVDLGPIGWVAVE